MAGLQSQARVSHLSSEDLQSKLAQAFGEREDLARRLKVAEEALGEKVRHTGCSSAVSLLFPEPTLVLLQGTKLCLLVRTPICFCPREQRMIRRGPHVSLSRSRLSGCRGSWQSSPGRGQGKWASTLPPLIQNNPVVLVEPRLVWREEESCLV